MHSPRCGAELGRSLGCMTASSNHAQRGKLTLSIKALEILFFRQVGRLHEFLNDRPLHFVVIGNCQRRRLPFLEEDDVVSGLTANPPATLKRARMSKARS